MSPAAKRNVHLVCNAHLDPVWLWEWEEGAAEAVSTFRVAADFCDQFDGFVFNHNEVILYEWVRSYEPALFRRIQKLVKAGRWHIMGGWYLQPDCNMPAGESFIRQIRLGRRYFAKHFGKTPTTAINFDPFGHSRGLVQVLAKSGYDSYLFCRPNQDDCPLPADTFLWEGHDGSQVMALRAYGMYGTHKGDARKKVESYLSNRPKEPLGLILWGVGNHGGGASREDIKALDALIAERDDVMILHSTPEAYFRQVARQREALPMHEGDLNAWAWGCYTSQVRLKQKHRQLENELYATEKMSTAAWQAGLADYPAEAIADAQHDLALGEFHDILPGSSIPAVEDTSIRLFDHALEKLSRVKTKAFFALAAGQKKGSERRIPILAYNPHPYPVRGIIECEFNLPNQNWDADITTVADVYHNGKPVACQFEKEASNIALDWRKHIVIDAELEPGRMNRLDCHMRQVKTAVPRRLKSASGVFRHKTKDVEIIINARTGLVDRYRVGGFDVLQPSSFSPLVMHDSADPWGMAQRSYRKRTGRFRPLSAVETARFCAVDANRLPAVRVIEDGPVRVLVEAVFGYGDSYLCQRYSLPKQGTELGVETRVFWNETCRFLKLAVPTTDTGARYLGQVAFGVDSLRDNGEEVVAQKWTATVASDDSWALTCINEGCYGSDFLAGEMRLSLLRSPAYSAHPIENRPLTAQDRFSPHIDQGERLFRFWLNAGPAKQRLEAIDREALAKNEKPMVLSFYPSGAGRSPKPLATLSDTAVQISAIKKAEDANAIILRLFNPTDRARKTTVALPVIGTRKQVSLGAFEVLTFKVDPKRKTWTAVDLMERPLRR